MLGVPLLREGTLLGVIILARTETRPFTEKQIDLVTTFADQAVIAINNVGLFEEVQARTAELQQSLEYQTATSDVAQRDQPFTVSNSAGARYHRGDCSAALRREACIHLPIRRVRSASPSVSQRIAGTWKKTWNAGEAEVPGWRL